MNQESPMSFDAKETALVIGLLFVQSIANLYLPELNADIINNGVVKGDLDYIWRTGAVMILVTLLFGGASVAGAYWGARESSSHQ